MDIQSCEFFTGGSDVINELREKNNNLQYEYEYLKGRKTVPIKLLFQDDLNTGLKVCSNAIQSTNDLFKSSDKKNTEMSSELKALERKVNEGFNEEKKIFVNLEINCLIFLRRAWKNCKT